MNIKETFGGHLGRWLVALLLLPPILLTMLGDYYLLFFILIVGVGGLTWWEYSVNLLGKERGGLLILALLGWLAVASGAYFVGPGGQQIGLMFALALGAIYTLWALERQSGPVLINLLARYALGHLYLSFLLSFILMTRKLDQGGLWLLYTLLVTIAGDTAAFYVGRKFKGPKLYPQASPNKTISGLIGGLVGAMLTSALSANYLPGGASWIILLGLGFFLGLWGAMGDLFESAIKRAVGIKDSSDLLLGHGGFWDRLDALMFNIAPIYIFADHVMSNI